MCLEMSLLYVTLPMWWSQWAWPTPHPTLHFSQLFLAPLSLSLWVLFSSYDLTSVSGKSNFPTPSKHCLILHHHHHPHQPLTPPPPNIPYPTHPRLTLESSADHILYGRLRTWYSNNRPRQQACFCFLLNSTII